MTHLLKTMPPERKLIKGNAKKKEKRGEREQLFSNIQNEKVALNRM